MADATDVAAAVAAVAVAAIHTEEAAVAAASAVAVGVAPRIGSAMTGTASMSGLCLACSGKFGGAVAVAVAVAAVAGPGVPAAGERSTSIRMVPSPAEVEEHIHENSDCRHPWLGGRTNRAAQQAEGNPVDSDANIEYRGPAVAADTSPHGGVQAFEAPGSPAHGEAGAAGEEAHTSESGRAAESEAG